MSIVEGELTRLALCWRLERKDGAGLAMTSHDRALLVDGVRYEPSPGMTPASIRSELGLDPRSSEVTGSISSEAISDADIWSGRWDGARLRLFAADWSNPADSRIDLLEGELGQISCKDGQFSAELLGVSVGLERPICPLTSPECRADLGDQHCRVDMAGRRLRARVVSADGHLLAIDRLVGEVFRFGQVRILGGAANGLKRRIMAVDGPDLTLIGTIPFTIEPGTAIELAEGCDKRLESCSSRFGNAANFRGEPHLPGNDLLTRYPGN